MRLRNPLAPVRRDFAARVRLTVLFSLLACFAIGTAFAASPPVPAVDRLLEAVHGERLTASPELPTLPTTASARGVVEAGKTQLRARLLVSSGPTPRVGVLFDLEPGWHLYWRNPGGTGIAPALHIEVPGHQTGEVAWPAPQTFDEAEGLFTTWGYEGSVLLSVPLEPVAPLEAAAPGEIGAGSDQRDARIKASPRVLVCRTQCVPAEFELSSPFSPDLGEDDQAQIDALFADALARVPGLASAAGVSLSAEWTSGSPSADELGQIELVVETCAANGAPCPTLAEPTASALFIPMEAETFEITKSAVVDSNETGGRFVLSLEATRLEPGTDRLWGLIPLRDSSGGLQHVEIDVPIGGGDRSAENAVDQAGVAPLAPPSNPPFSGLRWIQIVLLALLGGLILNGMPCVLPVLAIKVFAIAGMAEKNPREVRLHGLAYTGGVLASMALLALVVLGLRSAGHSVGWGFQFQEPLFVAVISAVLVTFALNLFGIFEIELGQGKLATVGQGATGLRRSAFEGLLAVVLATPCTAPFLGTAVGFAFASSGFGIAAIFLAIGLGLASPFLVVSFVPKFARFIPRSGPWMNTFRAGLGFSLLATVVWLLWILGQSGGVSAVISMTGVLLFLSFMLWGFGRFQPLRSAWVGRASAVTIAALAFAGFNLIEFDRVADSEGTTAAESHEDSWQTYSEAAVAASLETGRPAFVVFTADWCITCQMNERTVLDRSVVREELALRNFSLFKADWTRRDEGIRTKLAEFGRAGVPLYLVYRPGHPNDPIVLSELLSQQEVLAALASAGGTRSI